MNGKLTWESTANLKTKQASGQFTPVNRVNRNSPHNMIFQLHVAIKKQLKSKFIRGSTFEN